MYGVETLISIEELEEALDISRSTAYDLLQSGELPCFKIGKKYKIPVSGVNEYIRRKMYPVEAIQSL